MGNSRSARGWLGRRHRSVPADSAHLASRFALARCSAFELELRAELDLMVAHGAPEPVSIIEQVAHDITVLAPAPDDGPP